MNDFEKTKNWTKWKKRRLICWNFVATRTSLLTAATSNIEQRKNREKILDDNQTDETKKKIWWKQNKRNDHEIKWWRRRRLVCFSATYRNAGFFFAGYSVSETVNSEHAGRLCSVHAKLDEFIFTPTPDISGVCEIRSNEFKWARERASVTIFIVTKVVTLNTPELCVYIIF